MSEKKERPKCNICGVTHWAGEPHRIDPGLAAEIINKLEAKIELLEQQLAARVAPSPAPEIEHVSISSAVSYYPPNYLQQQYNALANAQNAYSQQGLANNPLMGLGGLFGCGR